MDEIVISVRELPNFGVMTSPLNIENTLRHYDIIWLHIENTYMTLCRHTNLCCLCQKRENTNGLVACVFLFTMQAFTLSLPDIYTKK